MTTKTISKICLLAALGLASVVFNACKKDEPNNTTTTSTSIQVTNKEALTQEVFADEQQAPKGVTFTTDGAWTSRITSSPDAALKETLTWISISPNSSSKAGDYTITISLETNTSGENRTAYIIISTATANITITITQKSETEDGTVPKKKPDDPVEPKPSDQTDPGVVINGVKWATRNVDAFGTFAATPQSAGKFYQWNRKKAWSATEPAAGIAIGEAGGWDATYPTGTTWEKANDPSPKGWRVPTKAEMDKLFDATKVSNEWTTQNGVTGRKFTDKSTGASLFFPAAGDRDGYDGTFYIAGVDGAYWSGTEYGSDGAYGLDFFSGFAAVDGLDRAYGFSVRSVAE